MSNKEKNLRKAIKQVGKEMRDIQKKENKLIIKMDKLQKDLAKAILKND